MSLPRREALLVGRSQDLSGSGSNGGLPYHLPRPLAARRVGAIFGPVAQVSPPEDWRQERVFKVIPGGGGEVVVTCVQNKLMKQINVTDC